MQNDSSKPDKVFETFHKGLTELAQYRYAPASEAFRQALDELEKTASEDQPRQTGLGYPVLKFFYEWSNGLAGYETGNFNQAREHFARAQEVGEFAPDSLKETILPEIGVFLKLIPLDERLKEILADPRDFRHLAGQLNQIFAPLVDVVSEAYLKGISEEMYILLSAKTNICSVLLYLLGHVPREGLMAVIRDDEANVLDEPDERLINKLLVQEQQALIGIHFEYTQKVIPAIGRFAQEMMALGAPKKLNEIPMDTQSQLVALLMPLCHLDGDFSKRYLIKPMTNELVDTVRDEFRQQREDLKVLLDGHSVADSSEKPLSSFPTPPDTDWRDLVLQFIDGHTIKASIKDVHKRYSYAELGFQDSRKGAPDSHWKTLQILAQSSGAIQWGDPDAGTHIKRSIQIIRQRLKAVFGLPGNSFFSYKLYKGYKTKFRLIPAY